jgi:hypothetical protein
MKPSCMKWSVLCGLVILSMWSAGCLSPEPGEPEPADELAGEHHPIVVARFDHDPTPDEVRAELDRLLAKASIGAGSSAINPGGGAPGAGQKGVLIKATTSDISKAGTDDASKVRFIGRWQAGNFTDYSEVFTLNTDRDDLDRASVSIFYYLVGMRYVGMTQDRFLEGQISNGSNDGWHCSSIQVLESNYMGVERAQWLPFNQWVQSPSTPVSSWLSATNSSWLGYY